MWIGKKRYQNSQAQWRIRNSQPEIDSLGNLGVGWRMGSCIKQPGDNVVLRKKKWKSVEVRVQ